MRGAGAFFQGITRYNSGMGVTGTLMTLEEFLRLPEEEGVKRELSEGVVVEERVARFQHELAKARLIRPLVVYLDAHPIGMVFVEIQCVLPGGDSYEPDLGIVLSERFRDIDPQKPFQGAPDLAIEVVSSDEAAHLWRKVRNYLRFGSRAVWVVYPEQKTVHLYRPGGIALVLEIGQTLEEPDLLPGFQLPVASVFEGV